MSLTVRESVTPRLAEWNNSSTYQTSLDSSLDSTTNTTLGGGQTYGITCKVMLIGDRGVGKTCLMVRYSEKSFLGDACFSTVGIDFRSKIVDVEGTKVKLQIWDTAGQERFRSITRAYYRDAQALMLLYDVTDKTSFDNVRAWIAEISEYANDEAIVVILGNKSDKAGRVVRTEDGERLAKEYGKDFMETSARTGSNVDLAFLSIARKLKSVMVTQPVDRYNCDEVRSNNHQTSRCCGYF